MWWSAGDPKNVLEFYSGDTLIGRFTTANLMDPLPPEYGGNPLNRGRSTAAGGFINFFGDEKRRGTCIVMTNNGSSGFESDNLHHACGGLGPAGRWQLPGVPS